MPTDLLMPKLGLTMTEGVLLKWKVQPGEAFSKGQILFVVETDKAATDIEAEANGTIATRLVEEGATVPVGTPVGRLVSDAALTLQVPAARAAVPQSSSPIPVAHDARSRARASDGGRLIATPLARRIARERGVDLAGVSGSGPRGRIKLIDVERSATAPAAQSLPPLRTVSPTPIQAAMARRLSQVKHGVPHFYLATEAEVSTLLATRAELNRDATRTKLTLTHFLLAAVGRSLVDCPGINRVWADGKIVSFTESDVSMAVETDGGLHVPVVRGAGSEPLDAIAARAGTAIERARAGALTAADMEGAAIAISNAGMHDVTWLTPIINPGQSAILGVGSVRELFRPGPDGAPLLKREMGLVLSADHRVHTGVEGLTFLNRVRAYLEDPQSLVRGHA
ncbi:MAG: dihydrolipoamide acetyltransferase family protein [Hyphomicrobiaceae bacterium]